MNAIRNTGILLLFVGAASCAPAIPPADLVTARAIYMRANESQAATLAPADLHQAAEALAVAEESFTRDGDTQTTRDLAYIADRRAQIAEARGGAIGSNQEQQQTLGNMHAAETSQLATTSGQLGQAKVALALQGQALLSQDQALAVEKQRRDEADKRAAKAAADLAAFASVKQETRGMVITLNGSVLFASNKTELLPSAQVRLNAVAESLTQQDTESKFVVQGYTDSQGGVAFNQDLSQRRAQSVRDYLVSRGVAADRVTAQGLGLTSPIADNATAEGRANNRRVEIVVQPGSQRPVASSSP
jgi:outer membrane protein OmpA-like peptidoglycan-associated protein